MNRRRVWAPIWAAFAWFALLRASSVQWLVAPDTPVHEIRIAAAYAIVLPVIAYAISRLGKRLRYVPAVALLDVHIIAVAWLHGGIGVVPTLPTVTWPFAGVAFGALLAVALEGTAPRVPPHRSAAGQ